MMATVKKLLMGIGLALGLLVLFHPAARMQDINCSGSFTPSFNCLITGIWDFMPSNSGTTYPLAFKVNGSEATGIVSSVVDLTNAQVLALGNTPITLVAAPGVGKFIDVIAVSLAFNYTGAYSSTKDVRLYWGSGALGNACSATITASGFFDASADKITRVSGVPDNEYPPTSNYPVVIQTVSGGNMAGGNAANTVRVVTNYRIVATGL